MASRCAPTMARATLAFEIVGYNLHKGIGKGKSILSTPVSIGRYRWCIGCYPDGTDKGKEYIPVFLLLLGKPAELRVLYDLRFVNKASGLSSSVDSYLESPRVVSSDGKPVAFELVKRSELEESGLQQDDCLLIECNITVIKETLLVEESVG
ncbi:hypothetical protein ACQ4PT_016212 [Festuca glaucescens]